ncbi:FecR domain-containing protein [Roseivirga sp.]|uniref:FecR domain-containing protein n=1 Tax=Roseivirga sp. TaxID=1964215 RepID=UPI003B51E7AB
MSSNSENSEDFLARWLSGEISPEEKEAFESSAEARDLKEILQSVDKVAMPAYDVEAELTRLKASIEQEKTATKVRSISPIWRMAVAAVLIIGVSFVYFLTRPNWEVYATGFGETQVITLPDRSVVTLNVNSVLKYKPDSYAENRELALTGEAFFEVTKGVNFQVNTDEGEVIVKGTSFNVRQRGERLDVQVYTGVVNVIENEVDKTLRKGDAIRIEKGRLVNESVNDVGEKPLWLTDNIVELEDVALADALESLRNSFGISIESDISLTSERFTGSYPGDNVEVAIQIVLSTHAIEYDYDSASKKLVIKGVAGN